MNTKTTNVVSSRSNMDKLSIKKAFNNQISRPNSTFVQLMDWVIDNFSQNLADTINLNKIINNRIEIEPHFLNFCEINKIKVETLYKDSIVSFKSSNDDSENFYALGVFRISNSEMEFLSAALFTDDTKPESEIFRFVIVSDANYQAYIDFRNSFDDWWEENAPFKLNIRVIDGIDISYQRNLSWNDLFLPETDKVEIKKLIDNLNGNKSFYIENNIPWRQGLVFHGEDGNGKNLIIQTIISNGNFSPITINGAGGAEALIEAFTLAEIEKNPLIYIENLDLLLEETIDPLLLIGLINRFPPTIKLLIIATIDNVDCLNEMSLDRPSLFSKKIKVLPPDDKTSSAFLKKKFGKLLDVKKINELAKKTNKNNFSYADLKELYISIMFETISNNRKVPLDRDVNKALDRMVKDKILLKLENSINIEQYVK